MKQALILLIAIAAAVSGCTKDSNNGGPPPPPPGAGAPGAITGWGSCTTCSASLRNPVVALVGVKSATFDEKVLFALDLIIDGALPGVNPADPKVFLRYSGPAVVQGIIRVTEANDVSVCNAAPGDYQLDPLTVSSAYLGVVRGGNFQAVGPGGRMMIRIGDSQVNNMTDPNGVHRDSPENRIGLNMIIDSVNNVPCGRLSTF